METSIQSKQLPRDVFLYFLMIFTLTTCALALGTILFQFINYYVPGQDAGYYAENIRYVLQFSVSSLVVMFPVLVWVLWYLKRDMVRDPEKRDLKIRKWLLYFALFVTGLSMLGDLVTLVYTLMQGQLTTRFVLEVLVVLWIAGSIFYYFLADLHDTRAKARRVVEWATILVVAAAVITSFVLVGSPAKQRASNNDDRRAADLQNLEYQVISYWQAKGKLPATLDDLKDGTISGSNPPPTDPKTGAAYEYHVQSSNGYQLCATFETMTSANVGGRTDVVMAPYPVKGGSISAWQHGQGRQCFQGSIDPDRYPLLTK